MRKPRIFTWKSLRPRNSMLPSGKPAAQIPGPVHPRTRLTTNGSLRKRLRRQLRTVQITPRYPAPPIYNSPPLLQELAHHTHPECKSACSRSVGRSERTAGSKSEAACRRRSVIRLLRSDHTALMQLYVLEAASECATASTSGQLLSAAYNANAKRIVHRISAWSSNACQHRWRRSRMVVMQFVLDNMLRQSIACMHLCPSGQAVQAGPDQQAATEFPNAMHRS